ncbi:MAG: HAD family hydrolase [Acidimicrobiales bacterium]
MTRIPTGRLGQSGAGSLGLPEDIRACLFDLDGVVTRTAVVHAAAWKEMFDAFLEQRAAQEGEEFVPFDEHDDYDTYVDGKPRDDGTSSFLGSRHIDLPLGQPDDRAGTNTIRGLGQAKNEIVLRLIRTEGVKPYQGSVAYLQAVRRAGLVTAVVSSSTNCQDVLEAVQLEHFFDVRIDGLVAKEAGLDGKPAPDTFLAAASRLGVDPQAAAVFEDAIAGVEAGRAGGFGWVVGVDRVGQAEQLESHGADVVVDDLAKLMVEP